LLGPDGQGPSQPTKETSERELSLNTIADLSVGVQSQVPRRLAGAREEE